MSYHEFSNVTLTSSQLSVTFYLPSGAQQDQDSEDLYYYSSRFDHGSMLGLVRTATHHSLYGTDMWKVPHNSHWPESGAGLASEFGVGDDGDLCIFRCGWTAATDVTNGVLGYREAASGESFLKIGVGQLVKGSCPTCDSTDDYRFNSPYEFAKRPKWKLTQMETSPLNHITALSLENEERLRTYGYKLQKDVAVHDNVVTVTTHLTNLGREPFSTVWYSHNFFTCDSVAVGPGYGVNLDIHPQTGQPLYDEPSTWSWSEPISNYGQVRATPSNTVQVDMTRTLDPGTRIKAEFRNDGETKGRFQIKVCDTAVESTLEFPTNRMSMYAYNLYAERGTFSPEPQLLISKLPPGEMVSWTQKVRITDPAVSADGPMSTGDISGWIAKPLPYRYIGRRGSSVFSVFLFCATALLLWQSWRRRRNRPEYETIV